MILHKEKVDVLGGFTVQREKEFGIAPAMVAHVVKTLIEMYSKPHTAVAREYIANAVDSHRQFRRLNPGATLPPIEVTTPTMLAPTFSVRDFGAGMIEDDTESLLSSFGSSGTEKRTSDEFVGGFGIGSKVGFAVADTYTYTVWHNGIKCIWICTIRADAKQAIQLIHKQPSDERSGVLVEVPIAEVDIEKVAEGISYTLRVLREQVLLDGVCVKPGYEVVDTPAGTYLRPNEVSEVTLACGDFTYGFPRKEVDCGLRCEYDKLIACAMALPGLSKVDTPLLYALSTGPSLYHGPGTFRPTPNREDLIWDRQAIARVNLSMEEALKEAEKEKQLLASSARTPLDSLRVLKALGFAGSTVLWKGNPLTFGDIPHYAESEYVATVKCFGSRWMGWNGRKCQCWISLPGLTSKYTPEISSPEALMHSDGVVCHGPHEYTLRQYIALEAEKMPEKALFDKIQAFRSRVVSANASLPQYQPKTHTDYLLVIGEEQDRKDTLAKLSWVISSVHPNVLTVPPKPPRKPRQPRIAGAPAVRVDSVSSKGWVMTSSSGLLVAKIPAPGRVVYGVGRPNLEMTASLHAMHYAWDDVIPGFRESIIYFLTEEAEKRFLSKHKGYAPVKLVDAVVEWLNTWAMLDPGGTGFGIEMLWAYAPWLRLPYVVGGEVQIDPHGLFQTSDIEQFLSASRWHALPVPPTGNLAASRFLEFYLRRTWRAGYPRGPSGDNFDLVRTRLLPAIYYCLRNGGGIGVELGSVLTEDSKRMALKKVGLFVEETRAFVREHPCVSYLFDTCRLRFKDAEDFQTKLWVSLNR